MAAAAPSSEAEGMSSATASGGLGGAAPAAVLAEPSEAADATTEPPTEPPESMEAAQAPTASSRTTAKRQAFFLRCRPGEGRVSRGSSSAPKISSATSGAEEQAAGVTDSMSSLATCIGSGESSCTPIFPYPLLFFVPGRAALALLVLKPSLPPCTVPCTSSRIMTIRLRVASMNCFRPCHARYRRARSHEQRTVAAVALGAVSAASGWALWAGTGSDPFLAKCQRPARV